MVKTFNQIDNELLELKRQIQQLRTSYLYFKEKNKESIYDENVLENTKEDRNTSRIKAGTN
jgi:hypothetical protein